MIRFRHALSLIAVFFSFYVGGVARAETIAATGNSVPVTTGMYWGVTQTAIKNYTSADAACKQANATWNALKYPANGYNQWVCRRADNTLVAGYTSASGCDGGNQINVGGNPSCGPAATVYTCPASQNWTLSGSSCTRPDCTAQESRNPSTGVCEALPCLSTAAVGPDGYFDYGTNAAGVFPGVVCAGGCLAVFSGSTPAGTSVVNGILHFYAFGGYDFLGAGAVDACTAGVEAVGTPSSSAALPAATCGGTDVATMINGVIKCVVKSSGAASSEAPKVGTVTTKTTQPDGSVLEVSTTTYGDGSQSYTSKIYDTASSASPSSSSTSVNGPPGSFADKASPGVLSAGGSGSGGTQTVEFPSDYSRAGEAATAAQSVSDALGPKLDKITEVGADPGELTQPSGAEFDQAFFQDTFTNLVGWQLPSHTSQCPTSTISFNDVSYTLNAHCQLIENHFSALSAVMSVVWTIVALFIVLGA